MSCEVCLWYLCVVQRLEVLHDDYVARLKSAEQDQEELRREVRCWF